MARPGTPRPICMSWPVYMSWLVLSHAVRCIWSLCATGNPSFARDFRLAALSRWRPPTRMRPPPTPMLSERQATSQASARPPGQARTMSQPSTFVTTPFRVFLFATYLKILDPYLDISGSAWVGRKIPSRACSDGGMLVARARRSRRITNDKSVEFPGLGPVSPRPGKTLKGVALKRQCASSP